MRILATLPTYNESENILPLMEEILNLGNEFEVLVIDDHSPDGTWKIVQTASESNSRIHLLHRVGRKGRGSAGLEGFLTARDVYHADAVVEMDADFSHAPRFIPGLLEPIRQGEADVVIGSRLVDGGGETGRHFVRKWITWAANTYIRVLLSLPLQDCTSGFRVFNRKALDAVPWDAMECTGPEIVQEVLMEASKAGLRFAERPILFEERRAGQSTFNAKIMVRSLGYMWKLRSRLRN